MHSVAFPVTSKIVILMALLNQWKCVADKSRMRLVKRLLTREERADALEDVMILILIAITGIVVIGTVGARAMALHETISRTK